MMHISRGGRTEFKEIAADSIIINSTGYAVKQKSLPYLSAGGKVLIPQTVFHTPGPSCYFFTRLWVHDVQAATNAAEKLLDMKMGTDSRVSYLYALCAFVNNLAVFFAHAPLEIIADYKGNLSDWHPPYKVFAVLNMFQELHPAMLAARKKLDQTYGSLDGVMENAS